MQYVSLTEASEVTGITRKLLADRIGVANLFLSAEMFEALKENPQARFSIDLKTRPRTKEGKYI